MAAAVPRLSEYEEFIDYERQKLGLDKEMIRLERVIAQLIQKNDTPEHIKDEFKTLCIRSSNKSYIYYQAVNNYYETIKNTDNKAFFEIVGKHINLFLTNIISDKANINAAKERIIRANKATKDELEKYDEYKQHIRLVSELNQLFKKIRGRIQELDKKEEAVKAAEAAAAAAQRKAAAVDAQRKVAAAVPAAKGIFSKTDFLTLERVNNIIAKDYSLAKTCTEDITDKGSDLLKQFDVAGKVMPSNDFTVIKASAGGINNQQALRNDCLIQAFLTSTCSAFRCLSQNDKDEFGNYFRRTVFLELLQNTPTYIAQPEIEDPVHPNGSREITRHEVSGTTPLSDRQLRMLCEIYRIGVMVFTLSKDPQHPGVRGKEVIIINPGALAITEVYVIYNPDNIHYDSVRAKGENTYTVTAAEAENYRANISVVGKSLATNTCKYNGGDVVRGLDEWVIISRKISDDKQYQHLAQQPCGHYVLMKHLDAQVESKHLDTLGSIAFKALDSGLAELSTSISSEGIKANTFRAGGITRLSVTETKALAQLAGATQYLIFEARVLENPRPLNILGALAAPAATATATATAMPVPPPPLRLAPVSTIAAPSVNAAAAQLAAAERLERIRAKFGLPAPAAAQAAAQAAAPAAAAPAAPNITAQMKAAAERLERLKAALTTKASKGGRSQKRRKTRRRHARTKKRRA